MAILKFNPMAYIKYFVLNAPMILAAFTVLASAFNKDIKGLVFMVGGLIIMFVGQFISSSLGRKPPKNINLEACNMFSSSGWGYEWSSPAPHALFLAYATTYFITSMAFQGNWNWALLGILLVIISTNAFFRINLLNCGTGGDLLFGWGFGMIWGVIWYTAMIAVESQNEGVLSLTYFGDEIGVDKCKLTKKKFKCRKI
uniref:Phosphatidic acid phosphatase type 2/haloperoxidase domain-containing protein n=1 Tax=viral metagenome TaxID=1070528 RepID=A0A6C0C551_9ZZZZ